MNTKQKYNYNPNFESKEIIDKNLLYENEDMPNMSSPKIDAKIKYDKSKIIETQNEDKNKDINKEIIKNKTFNKKVNQKNMKNLKMSLKDNKNIDIYKKYTHSLLYETQTILNYANNIGKINKSNNKGVINNNKAKKNIIIKNPIKNDEKIEQENNKNIGEKFLDIFLNFDYSRYTNKDKDNGQYYFKQNHKNKYKNKSNENLIIKKNEENKNNNFNYIKKSFINHDNNKSEFLQNNKNIIYNDEYITETKNVYNKIDNKNFNSNNFKNEENNDNTIIKDKNNYKYIIEQEKIYQNKNKDNLLNNYKEMNNYDKYLSNNNFKKLNNYKNKEKNNYSSNNINNNKNKYFLEKQYIYSLENSRGMKTSKYIKIVKKPKKQYHGNTQSTRNLQDKILDRINNSYKINNNMNKTTTNFNYNKKEDKNYFDIFKINFTKEKKIVKIDLALYLLLQKTIIY